MPVYACSNGKYRIGGGPCMYKSKAKALRAYAAYRAVSHSEAEILYLRLVLLEIARAKIILRTIK